MQRRVLCLCVLLAFSSLGSAATVVVEWQNATQNVDGTAIPETGNDALVRTTVEYGTCNGDTFGEKAGEIFVPAPETSLELNLVVVQQYCLRAFHSNGHAVDFVAGATGNSDFSNLVAYTVVAPQPAPPGPLVVQAELTTAYGVSESIDRLVLFPVGEVMAGVQCDPTQSVNGHYLVPREFVTWYADSNVTPAAVVAACGAP